MATLHFQLFGKFTAQKNGQPLNGLDASKDQELLSYLLIHRERHHSREALATLLWGDSSTEKSKKYLRQSLWHLQTVLESNEQDRSYPLLVEHDWLKLNPRSEVGSDVAEFERAFTDAQGIAGAQLDSGRADVLRNAVETYRGDLLTGWYQDWILFERERLQNMYLMMLDKLICYSDHHRAHEAAQIFAATVLGYEPARERTHRQLMSSYYLAGDRTAALRQYDRCVAALKEELGVRPERRTTQLYEQIRSDEFKPSNSSEYRLTASNNVLSGDVVGRLRQLQTFLSAVQRRIQREIRAVEGLSRSDD
jgi:DNA-binding SARP family transcriptional activator